ncbi:16102_t:CDS:2 [Funneliformis caledonium]|uniref:16102_t:CDS:1 n=1 Tax=Funneliformis caledonium TaxID=1117310 RepID=A0A9N8WCK9_9GLOM|nr:16102_t:CDS:2 [Funneliformis caledonium]
MSSVDRPILPDESNTTAEMKNLIKGQIPAEYQLNYEKMFSEQVTTIYENLILELKRMMKAGTLRKVDRRLHANTRLAELKSLLQDVLDLMAEQQANNNNKYYETDETNEMNEFINYDYFDAEDNINDKD